MLDPSSATLPWYRLLYRRCHGSISVERASCSLISDPGMRSIPVRLAGDSCSVNSPVTTACQRWPELCGRSQRSQPGWSSRISTPSLGGSTTGRASMGFLWRLAQASIFDGRQQSPTRLTLLLNRSCGGCSRRATGFPFFMTSFLDLR
jgi:hypothetical protein